MQRRHRNNFDEKDPILIAKPAPIETYWSQTQKISSRIILDAKGEEVKEIYTCLSKPES